jgi:hypothetical protein
MTRGRIFVTFGIVLLILALLAGIAVGIYYLVEYFKSPIVIDEVYLEVAPDGLATSNLIISFHKTGECIDCNPVLNFADVSDANFNLLGSGTSFTELTKTGPKSWKGKILLSTRYTLTQNYTYNSYFSIKVSDSTITKNYPAVGRIARS